MDRRHFICCTGAAMGTLSRPAQAQGYGAGCIPTYQPGVGLCRNTIDGLELIGALDTQRASQWCWAACISMIFSFYNHPVSQRRIVAEMFGGITNWPGSPLVILRALNRRWKDDDGEDFRSVGDSMSVNITTIGDDLKNNHPVILGALGHATVIVNWTYLMDIYGRWQMQDIEVADPWPYSPRVRPLTPQEALNASFSARVRVID